EKISAVAMGGVKRDREGSWKLAHVHVYRASDGDERMRVLRFEAEEGHEKTFRVVRQTPDGWQFGDPPKPLPPYRLFENQNQPVISVHEGELCADLGALLGQAATTSAHGANCPQNTDWRALLTATITEIDIYPDNNKVGRQYGERIVGLLRAGGSK